jgi:hypothetical protein
MSMDKMSVLRQNDTNKKSDKTVPTVAVEALDVAAKKATAEAYLQIEQFIKGRIAYLIDTIKSERMSKRL